MTINDLKAAGITVTVVTDAEPPAPVKPTFYTYEGAVYCPECTFRIMCQIEQESPTLDLDEATTDDYPFPIYSVNGTSLRQLCEDCGTDWLHLSDADVRSIQDDIDELEHVLRNRALNAFDGQ